MFTPIRKTGITAPGARPRTTESAPKKPAPRGGMIPIPSFQKGGTMRNSGVARLHKGERASGRR